MQFVRAILSGNFSMFESLGGLYVYYDSKSTLAVEISFVKYKVFQWNQYPVLKKDRNRISVIQKLHDGLISKFFLPTKYLTLDMAALALFYLTATLSIC